MIALDAHHKPHPFAADVPDVPDVFGLKRPYHGIALASPPERLLQHVQPMHQLRLAFTEVFGDEHGARISLNKRGQQRRVARRVARRLNGHAVEQFDGRRLGLQDGRHGTQRLVARVKVDHAQRRALRTRHQFHGQFGHDSQRTLAAAEQLRQVAFGRVQQVFKPIAAVAAPVAGCVACDDIAFFAQQGIQLAIKLAFGSVTAYALGPGVGRKRLETHGRAVGQQRLDRVHVPDHVAVKDRVRPGRVVGEHAAQRGAASAGRIGSHHQAVGLQRPVELLQRTSRFHPDPPRVHIDFQNAVQVRCEVYHQRFVDGLSGQRRTTAARKYRDTEFLRQLQRSLYVVGMRGQQHTDRLHPVDAGIGGIEGPRHRVHAERSSETLAQPGGKFLQAFGRKDGSGGANQRFHDGTSCMKRTGYFTAPAARRSEAATRLPRDRKTGCCRPSIRARLRRRAPGSHGGAEGARPAAAGRAGGCGR